MTQSKNEKPNVAIVGGGPIGIELAIGFERAGVNYTLFEAHQIGHEFTKWPPQTHFFSSTEHVALAGVPVHNLDQRPITGEEYLVYLRMLVEMFDLNLHIYEPVTAVEREEAGFTLHTQTRTGPKQYQFDKVVLATGGLARPRMLGIPGEDLPHVSHYFKGPHPYFRTRLLIVGGRNSAAEAAIRCWRAGAEVTLSYRGEDINWERVKPHLSDDLQTRIRNGEIQYLPATIPVEIAPTHVTLASTTDGVTPNGRLLRHEVDFVLLATGFEADMSLFTKAGVALVGRGQAPYHDPETMETNVPGLFVAGTAAGGTQYKFEFFISTTHHHVTNIVRAIANADAGPVGTTERRYHEATWEEVKAN